MEIKGGEIIIVKIIDYNEVKQTEIKIHMEINKLKSRRD